MNRDEKHEIKCKEIAELTERFLPLTVFNFHQNERIINPYPAVVYNSDWCRLRILWDGWDALTGDVVQIYYGRLHAVSDKFTILWEGEECYCWHDIKLVINFLDELSPIEAYKQLYVHGKWPQVMNEFKESEIGKNLLHNQPEWLIRMHAVAWDRYGHSLFKLFDLRNSIMWEKYVNFLKEYYKLASIGPSPIGFPPRYKVC